MTFSKMTVSSGFLFSDFLFPIKFGNQQLQTMFFEKNKTFFSEVYLNAQTFLSWKIGKEPLFRITFDLSEKVH